MNDFNPPLELPLGGGVFFLLILVVGIVTIISVINRRTGSHDSRHDYLRRHKNNRSHTGFGASSGSWFSDSGGGFDGGDSGGGGD